MEMCPRCVMDDSAPDFVATEGGCNYCDDYFFAKSDPRQVTGSKDKTASLQALVSKTQRSGRNKPYDCIVGVSGGADSSWTLVKVVELGLRPLAVHMDNGWNSDLAVSNIHKLVTGLAVDLHTEVLDWGEYRNLMKAFFAADVVDIELLYDNAMYSACLKQARKQGLRVVLSGNNHATEGFRIPPGWNWIDKHDGGNIRSIARWHRARIRSFPVYSNWDFVWDYFVKKIKWLSFLDYLDYDKPGAMLNLSERFGFRPYPYKHYENVFTRFYQGYLLPEKFHIDKRRPHLSALVCSGKMDREDAEKDLLGNPYPSLEELEQDRTFFLKKMGWEKEELENYLRRPGRRHDEWFTETNFFGPLKEAFLGRKYPNRNRQERLLSVTKKAT